MENGKIYEFGFYSNGVMGGEDDKELTRKFNILQALICGENKKYENEIKCEAEIAGNKYTIIEKYDEDTGIVQGELYENGKILFEYINEYPGYYRISVTENEFEGIINTIIDAWVETRLY